MTNISITTGLPELPKDNLFWRVGAATPSRNFFLFGHSGASISIVETVKSETLEMQYIRLPFGLKIPRGHKTLVDYTENTIVRTPIITEELVDTTLYDDNDEPKGITQTKERNNVEGDDLTPELILEHAHKTLARYHEITKSRGYLGDYPPKTLLITEH